MSPCWITMRSTKPMPGSLHFAARAYDSKAPGTEP